MLRSQNESEFFMLAIIEAYRAGLFKKGNWWPNLIAGIVVAIVALPLAMAFSIASGATPVQGLYTAIIAAIFVGVFGGSRIQIAGPTGAFIVILANITAHYGISGLQLASLMAGFILIFMGLLKLGSVIKFIPDPVIVGFTTGIGIIIFVGEWKDFFGLSVHLPLDAHFYQKVALLAHALPGLNGTTTALACLSLALVMLTPRFLKRIPGPLVAMLIVTGLQAIFHFKGVATIGSTFGNIPNHFPYFNWPTVSFNQLVNLVGPAFTIALLGSIESLLSATAADSLVGTRHDSNQELIGQGLANIASPLFGGFAATGAIARTVTNLRNGGNSPVAAITHSIVLTLVLILLAPLAADIPLCTLAAILFVVAYNMSNIPHFIRMIKRAPRYDVTTLLITFLLTVFINLVVAVNVGVILAMLFFVRRMHQSITVELQHTETIKAEFPSEGIPSLPANTMIYTIQGPFFFGVAEKIERILAKNNSDPSIIIFRLKNVPFMDITGLETFKEIIENFDKRSVKVYLCEATPKVAEKLTRTDIIHSVGGNRIFRSLTELLAHIAHDQ